MKKLWALLYNTVFIPLFWICIQCAALFNGKIRRGIKGRTGLFDKIERELPKLTSPRRVWFHSSSMGEFEQAKPIIAALRKKYRDIHIIVTFFSPSGYDHSKNYKFADIITYIPFDTSANARRFLDLIQPTAAVFVRYDVWPNHLWELQKRGIPAFIANATMRPTSARFYPLLKNFHRLLFNNFESILTVSAQDAESFGLFGLTNPAVEAIGDTRYDQVWQRSADAKKKHLIPPSILKGKKLFLAGSTWPEDEEVLIPSIKKLLQYDSSVLVILVPHEPTEDALEDIENKLGSKPRSIRFSNLIDYANERMIIVDSVGILMALYQYANVAYVGGSFRQGIHNVLEPAVYGIPVVYGPKHTNSREALELARRGGGFIVNDQQECYRTLRNLLDDKKANTAAGKQALLLVEENIGATDRFIEHLEKIYASKQPGA
ncbi:MAG: 3-deoxy-D-manno-octulosonic acid transferase [Ignavibacteriae bacterium]|nr:MAG: 3-deoxy-D-manno-octulosonic acid transferase [Ignavibacteriota bacterium]